MRKPDFAIEEIRDEEGVQAAIRKARGLRVGD